MPLTLVTGLNNNDGTTVAVEYKYSKLCPSQIRKSQIIA